MRHRIVDGSLEDPLFQAYFVPSRTSFRGNCPAPGSTVGSAAARRLAAADRCSPQSAAISAIGTNAKCNDTHYLVAIRGKTNVARTSRFVDSEVIRGMPLQEVAGNGREAWRAVSGALRGCCEQHFVPAHNPRALMSYCVRNLYVAIRATMLAKISSAGRDFRIIGPVEWRAADPG